MTATELMVGRDGAKVEIYPFHECYPNQPDLFHAGCDQHPDFGWCDPLDDVRRSASTHLSEAHGGVGQETPEQFLSWLISLDDDDPRSPGRQDRRTVSLTQIINRARAAAEQMQTEWGRRIKDDSCGNGHLIGQVTSIFHSEVEVRSHLFSDQEVVVREATPWQEVSRG